MKRDMELIRKLVLIVEEASDDVESFHLQVEGYSREQIIYHANLLLEAGLAHGQAVTTMGTSVPWVVLNRLTYEGHEFADKASNETIWSKTAAYLEEKGSPIRTVSFGILTQVLSTVAKKHFGLE